MPFDNALRQRVRSFSLKRLCPILHIPLQNLDAFDFPIVNFPTLSGNIPRKSSYGVFIGELVRYARACTYLEDFRARTLPLVSKLKKQFFL